MLAHEMFDRLSERLREGMRDGMSPEVIDEADALWDAIIALAREVDVLATKESDHAWAYTARTSGDEGCGDTRRVGVVERL